MFHVNFGAFSMFGALSADVESDVFGEVLKSVAYQPVPFKWKPAAEINFFKELCPQLGQVVKTGSLIFCKRSK
jgi:hypothetical protein